MPTRRTTSYRRRRPKPAPERKHLGTTYDQAGNVIPDPVVTAPSDVADITVTAPPLTAPNIFLVGAIIALAWWLWGELDLEG
jgi:hypothetical protein